jgi:hypothetical protein
MSIGFDTHAVANRFKAAGFTEPQVEALVETARETTGLPDISTLATKADLDRQSAMTKFDLAQLEGRLGGKIDSVQAELKTEIAGVRALIASTQVQTITTVLVAMVALTTLSTLASKLIR